MNTAKPSRGALLWRWVFAWGYAWAVFGFNWASCASPAWFHDHQSVSDDLVWAYVRLPNEALPGGPPYLVRPQVATPCAVFVHTLRPHALVPASPFETAWLYAPQCLGTDADMYGSQLGLQGPAVRQTVASIDAVMHPWLGTATPAGALFYTLAAMRLVQAAWAAAVVACIVVWVGCTFGAGGFVAAAASLSCSPWLAVFAHSVYWQLGFLLLPFAAAALLTQARRRAATAAGRQALTAALWLGLPCLTALKAAMGYEYITTIALGAVIPLVVEAQLTGRRWRRLAAEATGILLATAAAVLAVMAWHAAALGHGGIHHGWQLIAERAAARTHPNLLGALAVPGADTAVAQAAWWPLVLGRYLVGFHTYNGVFVPFGALFALFFWAAHKSEAAWRRPYLTWLGIALVPPLSWLIVAKGHSAAHPHLNFLLWHLPTTWLGWGIVGRWVQTQIAARRLRH